MFFSERLECSSFYKLLENVSEISRKKFAQLSEFARVTSFFLDISSQFSSGQQNAVLKTLLKLFGESLKIFNAKFGRRGKKDFFKTDFLTFFPQGV